MKPCSVAGDRVNEAGEHQGKVLSLVFTKETQKVLTFPISSRTRRTMMPYIIRYTQTGSLYYTDGWFAYTSLPIRGNHVVVLKKRYLKAETTSMVLRDSGPLLNIGSISIGV